MIRKFGIENFYSIADYQELDFIIAKNAPDLPGVFDDSLVNSDDRITKIAAIFGANASGKSTVLRAFSFLQSFITESFYEDPNDSLPMFPFSNAEYREKDSKIFVEFEADLIDENFFVYRYELIIKNGYDLIIKNNEKNILSSIVKSESLYYLPYGKPARLFVREGELVKDSKIFRITKRDYPSSNLRANTSLLAILAQYSHPLASKINLLIKNSLKTNLTISKYEFDTKTMINYYNENPEVLKKLINHISFMDFGIESIKLDKNKNNEIVPTFMHRGLYAPITLPFESSGTQKLFNIFPIINYVLSVGGVAVLDEIDNDIHSLLLPEIINWFRNKESNSLNAQLIIACHNASILDSLEKEEVFFTEKSHDGKTIVFALQDINNVRRDENIYKKYLSGIYGAVPKLG